MKMSTKPEQDIKDKDQQELNREETGAEEETTETTAEESSETDDLLIEQQNRINELEQELSRMKDTVLRKVADIDNQKKRLKRDREQIYRTSKEAAVESFLPVNDDLLRTLEAMEKADVDGSFLDGIRMVANKFDQVLESYGVERIDETGVPFDVDYHDAMMRQKPKDDSVDSGVVLQVLENGYKMGDKTLRHAKVIVSE